jgi:hypothetical protein
MYSREQRPLNEKEIRSLRLAIASAKKQIAPRQKWAFIGVPLVIVVLWGVTLMVAGKSALLYASLLWFFVALPILVSAGAEVISPHRKRITRSEDAISNGRAEEIRITADAMVELQEISDLGVCYAFQVEPDRIIFVCGQDFYPRAKFPSSDFTIINILGSKWELVDLQIEKRGEKLRPMRKITVEARKTLRYPEHLEVVSGSLDKLEEILKKP